MRTPAVNSTFSVKINNIHIDVFGSIHKLGGMTGKRKHRPGISKTAGGLVGINVKRLREQKKWTVETLANMLEFSPSYLYRIESGQCRTLKVAQKLANALGVDIAELFREGSR